jgi:drug/metabolite transporter (DMT)-like permease
MIWQYSLGALIAINITSITLSKVASDKTEKKSIQLFYQFFFCLLAAISYAFLTKEFNPSPVIIPLLISGSFNALANYSFLSAVELSLSKTSLFLPFVDIFSLLLTIIFLGENLLFTFQVAAGIILCFLAMFLFQTSSKRENSSKEMDKKKWFIFTLLMILIYGVSVFLIRIFSATITRGDFLIGFYLGSFFGSLPIILWEKQNPAKISRKMTLLFIVISLAIFSNLSFLYLTFQLGGPASIVLPVRRSIATIATVLIGWLIFKERRGISKKEILGFVIGIIGVVVILI